MSSFTNLLSRLNVLSEAKISPMDKILPGFQTQARSLASSKGASSGTREGRLAMLAILFDLDIIDESIVRMFKNDSSVSRMVDYFETNGISKKIRERSDDIGEHISNQLENKVSFTTGNRTDSAQQRYEVNKLNAELKANKKTARIEKKKETASAAGYWDTTDSFVSSFNSLVELNRTHKITIEAPLLTMSKKDIVLEGIKLGVKFEDTWTCYSSREDGLADASTPSSSLRLRGFIDSGYEDPIRYLQQDKIDRLYTEHNFKKLHSVSS